MPRGVWTWTIERRPGRFIGSLFQEEFKMDFGFSIPTRGPLANKDSIRKIAQRGEELGYRYLCASDHIVIPRTITPNYPYTQNGVPSFSGECLEQLTLLTWLAAVTNEVRRSTGSGVPHGCAERAAWRADATPRPGPARSVGSARARGGGLPRAWSRPDRGRRSRPPAGSATRPFRPAAAACTCAARARPGAGLRGFARAAQRCRG